MKVNRAQQIAQRQKLLELEAQVQRATLAATLTQLEQHRVLTYAAGLGAVAVKLLKVPQLRWFLMATVLSKLRRRKAGLFGSKDKD